MALNRCGQSLAFRRSRRLCDQFKERRVADVVGADKSIEQLVADFITVHRDFVDKRRALEYLSPMLPDNLKFWRAERDWRDLPGDKPWRDIVNALRTDANFCFGEKN